MVIKLWLSPRLILLYKHDRCERRLVDGIVTLSSSRAFSCVFIFARLTAVTRRVI